MPEFFQRLMQRKLMQWCLAYLAGAWVLLQVIDFVAENLGWPAQVSRISLALAGVGFLIVVVLAWYHGEQGRQQVTIPEIVIMGSLLLIGVAAVASMRSEPGVTGATTSVTDSMPPTEERSLAVLPFANLSEEKSNEYFSDGITEEILNTVARLPGLRVASRTSSFSFKGQSVGLDQIAQRLRVAHVLEGSVRKFGQRVVISAKLIDTRTDRQVWSKDFDRDLKDVFAVQQDIARAIAQAMEIQFGSAIAASSPTENARAHDSYLLGLDQWHRRTRGGMAQAVTHFKAAVDEDPSYAEAWSGLALAYAVLPIYDQRASEAESARLALEAAGKALALDSTLAHPHAAIGWIVGLNQWRWPEGIKELRQAVAMSPNDAISRIWMATVLIRNRHIEEALEHSEAAVGMDPLSLSPHQQRAIILLQAGQTEPAFAEFRVAHGIEPDNQIVLAYLARLYLTHAKYDSAASALRRIAQVSDYANPEEGAAIAEAARAKQPTRAGALLTGWSKASLLPDFHLAMLHQVAGDRDGAMRALERSFNARELNISSLNVDPIFEPLRSDPRVITMLRRMNLR